MAGREIPIPIPLLGGAHLKDFFDSIVCGTVDLYLAGHDHGRQRLDESETLCGGELIVSGAGAKTRPRVDRGNASFFKEHVTPGFLYVIAETTRLAGRFVDKVGNFDFERTVSK